MDFVKDVPSDSKITNIPLYGKVIFTTMILFIAVFWLLKHNNGTVNFQYEKDVEKQLRNIQLEVQNIAFSLPDTLLSHGRTDLISKIQNDSSLILSIKEKMKEIRNSFPDNPNPREKNNNSHLFPFYSFLEENLTSLNKTIEHITKTAPFDDISADIQKLITISKEISYFPIEKNPSALKEAISAFSLKKSN